MEYSSSNESVLVVDQMTGLVSAVGEGMATMKVDATDGCGITSSTDSDVVVDSDKLFPESIVLRSPNTIIATFVDAVEEATATNTAFYELDIDAVVENPTSVELASGDPNPVVITATTSFYDGDSVQVIFAEGGVTDTEGNGVISSP